MFSLASCVFGFDKGGASIHFLAQCVIYVEHIVRFSRVPTEKAALFITSQGPGLHLSALQELSLNKGCSGHWEPRGGTQAGLGRALSFGAVLRGRLVPWDCTLKMKLRVAEMTGQRARPVGAGTLGTDTHFVHSVWCQGKVWHPVGPGGCPPGRALPASVLSRQSHVAVLSP